MRSMRVVLAAVVSALLPLLAPLQASAGPAVATTSGPFAVGGTDNVRLPDLPNRPGRRIPGPSMSGILNASDQSPVANYRSVPTWQATYRTDGAGKPFQTLMVGTDPSAGSATTSVPVVAVPIRLVFGSDGQVLEDPGMVADAAASPMFQPTQFVTGTTQYPDAYQRGSFWSQVSTTSRDYHVLLSGPTVLPTQTLDVPAGDGFTYFVHDAGVRLGIVQDAWFNDQVQRLISDLQIDPTTLVAFLTYDTYFSPNPADCFGPNCSFFIGYHGALPQGRPGDSGTTPLAVNTFVAASFLDFGSLVPPNIDLGLEVFSHEVLEWLVDPFAFTTSTTGQLAIGSTAPRWTSPLYPFFCDSLMEVSDPVQGLEYGIGVPGENGKLYVLEDAAMFSWFARQTPSTAVGGRYDVAGRLTGISQSC